MGGRWGGDVFGGELRRRIMQRLHEKGFTLLQHIRDARARIGGAVGAEVRHQIIVGVEVRAPGLIAGPLGKKIGQPRVHEVEELAQLEVRGEAWGAKESLNAVSRDAERIRCNVDEQEDVSNKNCPHNSIAYLNP